MRPAQKARDNFESAGVDDHAAPASMRPAQKARDNARRPARRPGAGRPASMRPAQKARDNSNEFAGQVEAGAASMRPAQKARDNEREIALGDTDFAELQ